MLFFWSAMLQLLDLSKLLPRLISTTSDPPIMHNAWLKSEATGKAAFTSPDMHRVEVLEARFLVF